MNSLRAPAIPLRALRRLALLLAMTGLAGWWLVRNPPDLQSLTGIDLSASRERPPESLRKIEYRLSDQGGTTFRFSQPVSTARVITYPIVSAQSVGPGRGWLYGFRAELLDSSGAVVWVKDIFSRTVLIDHKGQRRGPYRYYRMNSDAIAPPDEVRIAGPQPFVAVRLTALPSDNGVIGIDVRVFERKPLIDSAAQSAFLRLDPEERARLAAPGAFAPELLTREERANIMRNQWLPVGPEGIEGRDYAMNVLYEEKATGKASSQTETEEVEE